VSLSNIGDTNKMYWILVYLTINGTTPIAVNALGPDHKFESMTECFFARENLSDVVGLGNGYYKPNSQAICVQIEK